MHRFSSSSVVTRFKIASLLLCLKYLLAPAAVGLLVYSLATGRRHLTFLAIGLGVATLFVIFIQWIIAERARCPLCMTPVLANKACAKHRHSRPLCGSYRLRVALGVLFRGSFVCPYCHEPSVMQVRHRGR